MNGTSKARQPSHNPSTGVFLRSPTFDKGQMAINSPAVGDSVDRFTSSPFGRSRRLVSAAPTMSSAAGEGSSSPRKGKEREEDGAGGMSRREEGVEVAGGEVDLGDLDGAAAGWVDARTSCPHLGAMPPAGADDLSCVPPPDSPCLRCHHPAENWLCLICKDVLCSRFINKHMLCHYQETGHCLALSFSDLSVWCFACDSYLDVQAILELRPVYEVAHLLKFGERPPFRSLEVLDLSTGDNGDSSSRA